MPGKRKGRKKGVAVDWWKEPGGLERRSMNLDFASLKPPNWLGLSFGFLSFRTVATINGSQKSHFYFLPVHHLLSNTTVSRLFTSTFDPPCVPAEFSEPRIIYESPVVPDSVRSVLSTAAFRFPFIYIFGGCRTTDAFALDLLAIDKGWQKLPPMSYPKGSPKAISIGDHIYVFGTSSPRTPDDAAFFVDVFDDFHNYWTPIDPGHSMLNMDPFLVPLKDWKTNNNYILLHDSRRHELHLYGTSEGGLALLPERSFHVRKQPALLNGVLYCYKQHGLERYHDDEGLGEVVGYNLNGDPKSWWTPIRVLGLSEHLSSSPVYDVHLLAIREENILCVLFSWDSLHCSYNDKSWPKDHNVRYVECSFFRMSIHNKPDEEANLLIEADHLFTTPFSIHGSSRLVDCLFV